MAWKYYLIDTENVGDRWFEMLRKIRKKDKIIVFYTAYHSRHLEEFLAEQVHNPKILWLECVAGNNALDYQMIGVLSYVIAKHPKASFCIYSNDKDYQKIVDTWKSRGIKISQKGFEIVSKKKKKEREKQNLEAKISQFPKTDKTELLYEEISEWEKLTEEQLVEGIARSVPVSNLNGWYQSLTAVLGQEKGRSWYLRIRDDDGLKEKFSKYCTGDEYSRGVNLTAVVLKRHNLDATRAEEAYRIIRSHNWKNAKAIKADFDKKFGKGQGYFKALRPLFRTIKGK